MSNLILPPGVELPGEEEKSVSMAELNQAGLEKATEAETQKAVEFALKRQELIDLFWKVYDEEGTIAAGEFLFTQLQGSIELTQFILPKLAETAEERDVNLAELVVEWNSVMENQYDTTSDDNDGGGISPEFDNEAVVDSNEDEAADARDADGCTDEENRCD